MAQSILRFNSPFVILHISVPARLKTGGHYAYCPKNAAHIQPFITMLFGRISS